MSDMQLANWPLKYRPRSLEDMVLTTALSKKLITCRNVKMDTSLLFHGAPGIGKTTAASLMGNTEVVYYIDCASEKGKAEIQLLDRNCSMACMIDSPRIVLLDEADKLTPKSFNTVRGVIDRHGRGNLFIMTMNETKVLPDRLRSRMDDCEFSSARGNPELIEGMVNYAMNILEKEGMKLDRAVVNTIARTYCPDVRQFMIRLQGEALRVYR